MERLIRLSNELLRRVPTEFTRYIKTQIDWEDQLIGISGARGSGKTVMLLQYLKKIQKKANAIYASLDDIYFSKNNLVFFAEEFQKKGGNLLLLDEVHKYPNWSQELKNIYDSYPDMKVVFTSSSALEIYRGSHDLSRRALVYNLAGLSFREFLLLKYKKDFPILSMDQILNSKPGLYSDILTEIKPIALFSEYLESGYYPFFMNTRASYLKQLLNTINLVVESDLPAIHNIDFNSILKIKKLLAVLSRITPYKPNIEKLAKQTGTSRDTLLKYLFYLEKAQIVKWLGRDTFGINYLNKPEKFYLNNTNLAYALGEQIQDIGNLRETFFLNQLSVNHTVTFPEKGDFLVDDKYLFEVGGRGKTQKQIMGINNAYIAADNIEYRYENKIPLWIFGFMY
jgi:predicted AAA+ superfamily ATPase